MPVAAVAAVFFHSIMFCSTRQSPFSLNTDSAYRCELFSSGISANTIPSMPFFCMSRNAGLHISFGIL